MAEMCPPDARPANCTQTIPNSIETDTPGLAQGKWPERLSTERLSTKGLSTERPERLSIERSVIQRSTELFSHHNAERQSCDQRSDYVNQSTASMPTSSRRSSSIDNQNGSSRDQLAAQPDRLNTSDHSPALPSRLQSCTSPHSLPMSNYSNQSDRPGHSVRRLGAAMSAHRRWSANHQSPEIKIEPSDRQSIDRKPTDHQLTARQPSATRRAVAKGLTSFLLISVYSLMSSLLGVLRQLLATKVFAPLRVLRDESIYLLSLQKPNLSSNLSNSLLTRVHSERFNDCFRAPTVETKNQSDECNQRAPSATSGEKATRSKRRSSTGHPFRWLLARNCLLFVLLTSTTSSAYDLSAAANTNYNLNNINGFNGYPNAGRQQPSIANPAKRSGVLLGGRGKPDAVIYFEDLNNEQFTHLTINPFNNDVYIGAVNRLYQLNSNLQVKHLANMGPQLDSAECPGVYLTHFHAAISQFT